MIKTFIYIEFSTLGLGGHHTFTLNNYAESVKNGEVSNCKTILICPKIESNLSDELSNYDEIHDKLPPPCDPSKETSSILNAFRVIDKLIKDLSRKNGQLTLYSHMPSPYSLLIILLVFLSTSKYKNFFFVRLCMTDEEWLWYDLPLSLILKYFLNCNENQNKFYVSTESIGLQEYFYNKLDIKFPIQFNPISNDSLKFARSLMNYKGESSQPLIFSYLGEAREEKGFKYIPNIISKLKKECLYPWKFICHSYTNANNKTEEIEKAKNSIENHANNNNVLIFSSPLPQYLYEYHLAISDVILLPYKIKNYKIRGSGIAYEALTYSNVLLGTKETDIVKTFKKSNKVLEFNTNINQENFKINELLELVHRNRYYQNFKESDNSFSINPNPSFYKILEHCILNESGFNKLYKNNIINIKSKIINILENNNKLKNTIVEIHDLFLKNTN